MIGISINTNNNLGFGWVFVFMITTLKNQQIMNILNDVMIPINDLEKDKNHGFNY